MTESTYIGLITSSPKKQKQNKTNDRKDMSTVSIYFKKTKTKKEAFPWPLGLGPSLKRYSFSLAALSPAGFTAGASRLAGLKSGDRLLEKEAEWGLLVSKKKSELCDKLETSLTRLQCQHSHRARAFWRGFKYRNRSGLHRDTVQNAVLQTSENSLLCTASGFQLSRFHFSSTS